MATQVTLNSGSVDSAGSLLLKTNGTTTAVTIDTAQNMGLGVTPSAWTRKAFQLGDAAAAYVANNSGGATVLATNMYFDGGNKYATSAAAARYSVGLGTHEWYTAGSGTAGNTITFTQAMTLDASGNLGIGTTSPSTQLHISKAGSTAARVTNSSVGAYAELGRDSTGAYVESSGAYPLQFYTNSTERARIDSSGNLLIGTTSAWSASVHLQVKAASGAAVASFEQVSSSGDNIYIRNTNGVVGSITTSGSSTAYNTSSDYRLKENIAPMTGALAKVAQLKPVTYTWKADGSAGEGFIAHELQAVVPDAVVGEKDAVDEEGNPKYQGIDTSFLVATLTAAIQEQQQIITALTARIEALEQA